MVEEAPPGLFEFELDLQFAQCLGLLVFAVLYK